MAGIIEERLRELGIELPEARAPRVAKIRGANLAGNILYVSGQVPQWNGEIRYIGKVGKDFTMEEGKAAARLSALNVLAHAKEALDGDLDRIAQVARIKGYVNATDDLVTIAEVMNGASELMVAVFHDDGHHARTVAGVSVMPFGVAIEVEAEFLVHG